MTKNDFRKHVFIFSLLMIIAIAIIISFCVLMFNRYSKPSDENTSIERGTVADVYYASGKDVVIIQMLDGERFQLVCPNFQQELYSTIGYDLDELSELLEGEKIEYRQMSSLPWIVEIYVDEIVIDNNVLTAKQMTVTRIAIVIIGLIMLAFPISGEVAYIKSKYKLYRKAEKKRARKTQRDLKKTS